MNNSGLVDRGEAVPYWGNYVGALSLGLLGAGLGDRIAQFLYWPLDRLARVANGMEPLPVTFDNAWSRTVSLPSDWWLVLGLGLAVGVSYVMAQVEVVRPARGFWTLFTLVFVLRFVIEGHIPVHGFQDYGVSHYLIYEAGLVMEILLTLGLAWVFSGLGWRLTAERKGL